MNKRIIVYILGWVLIIEGAAMQIATATSFIYGEHEGLYFLFTGAASAILGLLAIKIKKPKNMVLYQKAGFAATALSWIMMSLVGCLPFWLSGEIPSILGTPDDFDVRDNATMITDTISISTTIMSIITLTILFKTFFIAGVSNHGLKLKISCN